MGENYNLILFDGVCNFCNSSVNFIIKRDNNNIFRFASLQSDTGQKYLLDLNFSGTGMDTLVLVERGQLHTRSTAALKIVKELNGFWKLLYLFIIIPKPIRDYFYNLVSRNRYKWFGKRDVCRIPTKEEKEKFL